MVEILLSLLIEIVMYIFFLLLGMNIIPKFNSNEKIIEDKIILYFLSPIVGFGFWIGINGFLCFLVPFNRITTLILLCIAIILIIYFRNRLSYFRDVIFLKKINVYLILIIVSSIVVMNIIIPRVIDGGLYFRVVDYDHARVAVVNSIMRNGLPMVCPYITYNGEMVKLAYHIGLHIVMTQISFIFNVSSIVSEAVVYGLAYVFTLSFCAIGIYKFSNRKISFIFMLLLFFFIAGYDKNTFYENIEEYGTVTFGFFSIFNILIWNTHHIVAATLSLIIIYLYANLVMRENKNLIYYALIGILAFASSIISIYSGAFSLALFMFIILIICGTTTNFRKAFKKAFLYQIFSVLIAFILAMPYLYSLINYSTNDKTNIYKFLKLMIYKHNNASFIYSVIEFYFIKLPEKFGILYVFGFIMMFYLVYILIKKKGNLFDDKIGENENNVKINNIIVKFCIYYVIISFVMIFLVRSDFYSNDFGWRIVICSEIILLCLAVILSTKIYDYIKIKNRYLLYMYLLIYFVISIFFMQGMINYNKLVCVDNPKLHKEFANAIKGWDVIKQYTKNTDIVFCNPKAYSELYDDEQMLKYGGYGVNIFCTHYGSRNTLIADYNYTRSSSEALLGEKYIKDLYDFSVRFFKGNPTKEDVDYICDVQKVKAILVTSYDGLYKNGGSINLKYPNKIEGLDYIVYFTEDIEIE